MFRALSDAFTRGVTDETERAVTGLRPYSHVQIRRRQLLTAQFHLSPPSTSKGVPIDLPSHFVRDPDDRMRLS